MGLRYRSISDLEDQLQNGLNVFIHHASDASIVLACGMGGGLHSQPVFLHTFIIGKKWWLFFY